MKKISKRFFSLALALLLMLGCLASFPNADVKVSAADGVKAKLDAFIQKSEYDSADTANIYVDKFLNMALAQEGKSGTDLGYSSAWCGYFVNWVAKQTEMTQYFPTQSQCANGALILRNMPNYGGKSYVFWSDMEEIGMTGITYSDRTTFDPLPGDIVVFRSSYNADGQSYVYRYQHVGIVYKVTDTDIYVVHGNWDKKVTVGTKFSRTGSNKYGDYYYLIAGYSRPNYPSSNYVFFDANGGTCSVTSIPITTGSVYKTFPTPTRVGYIFQGWFTDSIGGTRIQAGEQVTATSSFTLYAHWSVNFIDIPDGTYYIKNRSNTYYMNIVNGVNANGQNVTTDVFDINPRQQMTITKTANGYRIRPGCTSTRVINVNVENGDNVDLWDETGDDSQLWKFAKHENGYIICSVEDSNRVLTIDSSGNVYVSTYTGDISQVWALQNTVFYDVKNGTGATSNYSQLKYYGEPITLTTQFPERYYHTFKGWSLDPECKTVDFQPGDVFDIDITENISIYAVWAIHCVLDVNACVDGNNVTVLDGVGTFDVYIDGILKKDDCSDFWIELPTGTHYEICDIKALEGYEYVGVAEGNLSGYIESHTYPRLIFNTAKTYTVTFKDWDGTTLKTQTVNYGSAATAPANPTRTGYTFTGWDKAFNDITANTTVNAVYTKKNENYPTYTVTLTDNGDGTATIVAKLPEGVASGKLVIDVSDKLSYISGSLSSVAAAAVNEDYSGGKLAISFSRTAVFAEGTVVFEASFRVDSSAELSVADFDAPEWNMTNGDIRLSSEADGDVIKLYEKKDYTLGDVNEDGYVDNLDSAWILKYDAGLINSSALNEKAADVNGDGWVDNLDSAWILKFDAGLIPDFGK